MLAKSNYTIIKFFIENIHFDQTRYKYPSYSPPSILWDGITTYPRCGSLLTYLPETPVFFPKD